MDGPIVADTCCAAIGAETWSPSRAYGHVLLRHVTGRVAQSWVGQEAHRHNDQQRRDSENGYAEWR